MLLTPPVNMVSVTLLKSYYESIPYVDLIGTFSLFIELLIYYMIYQSTGEYQKRIVLELIAQQKNYQEKYMEDMQSIVSDYHRLRHDMKNHFVCMDGLISQGKYDALKQYFYTFSHDIYALDNQIETGNEIVNQVVNIKYAVMRQQSIPVTIDAQLPSKLNIPDYLLCSLLSNLLDNAIEASGKIGNPQIIFQMKLVKAYLSITIKNRIEDWQYESALSHKTTKEQPQHHGMGVQIVNHIVERYNGMASCRRFLSGFGSLMVRFDALLVLCLLFSVSRAIL